jgi:predicted ester cyclase
MKHHIGLIGLAVVGLAACQQQEPAAAPLAAPPPAEPVAVAPAAPPAAAPAEAPKPPPPATADERGKWFKECWGLFNAKDFSKFSNCYAESATSEQVDSGMPPLSGRSNIVDKNAKVFATAFPDLTGENELTIVSGDDILSVVLLKGTQKGALPGPQGGEIAPTNKKIGYLAVQHVVTSPDGRSVAKERFIYDGGTFMSQLGLSPTPARKAMEQGWAEKPLLVSAGTDAEKANLAVLGAYTAAFNKHDAAALTATLTDDVVFSDLAAPADRVGKKEVVKSSEEMFKGFPDAKIDQAVAWAAGDYVVSSGRFSGTNTGDMPAMKLKKTGKPVNVEYYMLTKVAGGKVKDLWLFSNGMAFASQLGMLPPAKGAKAEAGKEPKPAAGKPGAAPAGKDGKPTPAAAAPPAPHTPAAAAAPAAPKAPAAAAAPAAPKAPAAAAAPAAPAAPKAAAPAAPAKPAAPAAAAPKPPAAPAAPAAPKAPATK